MKSLHFFSSVAAVAFIAIFLGSCTTNSAELSDSDLYASKAEPVTPAITLSGNYLAGRYAQRLQDWQAAQTYINAVADIDQGNELMLQRAFLLTIGSGEYEKAKQLADKIIASGEGTELAVIFLTCDAMSKKDFDRAISMLDKLPDEGFGDYTKPLLTAWAMAGKGDIDAALAILADKASPEDPAYNIHAGLMFKMTGDMNKASEHYKAAMKEGLTLHTAMIVGRFFARYGQPEIASQIFDGLGSLYPYNPFVGAADKAGATPNIANAAEGASYALFDIATLLYERRAYDSAQIYGSMVQLLMPQAPFAFLMMGDIAAIHEQYPQSIASYEAVSTDSPLFWLSRMRIAEVYEAGDSPDRAILLLTELAKHPETRTRALITLGDLQRRREKFNEAAEAYDEALRSIGKLTEEHWPVIYARGMSLERSNKWDLAEKDLLQALKFQPDNPMILNYIGYSWAEKGMHLDKALGYLKRAAALKPEDGYILDSLGWALYKTGSIKDAVVTLEKAVAQVPDDSTILDHLGDAYWQTGRKTEAKFQWQRALSLSRDTAFRTSMTGKLRNGIEKAPHEIARTETDL